MLAGIEMSSVLRLKKCPDCGSVQLIEAGFCTWCAHLFKTIFPGTKLRPVQARIPSIPVIQPAKTPWKFEANERWRLAFTVFCVLLAITIIWFALHSINNGAAAPPVQTSRPL